jgi:hypothetical protein
VISVLVGFLASFGGFSQIMLPFSIRQAGKEAVAIDLRARADQTDLQGTFPVGGREARSGHSSHYQP